MNSTQNDQMMTIEFDVAWGPDETFDDVLNEIERECGATAVLIDESGPGGGWPVVKFTVSAAGLVGLIERLGYDDDIEFWVEQAEPA